MIDGRLRLGHHDIEAMRLSDVVPILAALFAEQWTGRYAAMFDFLDTYGTPAARPRSPEPEAEMVTVEEWGMSDDAQAAQEAMMRMVRASV